MAVKPVPDGYPTVAPYLIVNNAARLIDFVQQAFGAREISRSHHADGTIMHAEVRIGDSLVMLADANANFPPMPAMLHLYLENVDRVYQQAMEAGASSIQKPEDQFYGDRSAGVKDDFGNLWWLTTHVEDVPPEEIERRAKARSQSR